MEQVYYTQCPMGHGLGAAGGFQLKRISAGYPRSADFRSLGLKVRMSGLSVLTPKALRFRWDGDVAELAWLAPRAREFEVAVGNGPKTRQYGRPGGLFAHGLRLDPDEFGRLDNWPAGLFGWDVWVESDPVPTAGKALGPVALTAPLLQNRRWMPTISDISKLARQYSRHHLACLLHSVAEVSRTARSLFLFDETDRANGEGLAELTAALTWAFPKGMRKELTFSTFHDRPSALPGYRIQGTTALGRADLASMQALGVVEDLARGPRAGAEPPRWADSLAGWLIEADEDAWTATCEDLFPVVIPRVPSDQVWEDAQLDGLFSFVEWNGLPPERLSERPVRERMGPLVSWAGKAGLARLWKDRHGADWWTQALRASGGSGTACSVLLAQTKWTGSRGQEGTSETPAREARRWAEVAALGFGSREAPDWQKALRVFLGGLPSSAVLPFLSALISASPHRAEATLSWLQDEQVLPPSVVLPLRAVRHLGPPLSLDRLSKVLGRSMERPGATLGVLDALRDELEARDQRAESLSTALADALFASKASRTPEAWKELWASVVTWAVRGPEAEGWLSATLKRTFSPPFDAEDWSDLVGRLRDPDRSAFAPLALATALGLPGDGRAYLWSVEALWLSLPAEARIERIEDDEDWSDPDRSRANAYVERLPEALDQFCRLFPPPGAESALSLWVRQAREANPPWLSPRNRERLDSWERLARTLQQGVPLKMLQVSSSDVPEPDRGRWLGAILKGLGKADRPGYLDDLESCGRAWSPLFESGSPHLEEVSEPLARALTPFLSDPNRWLGMLSNMESRLHVSDRNDARKSEGLAAHVLAWTARLHGENPPWDLRRLILRASEWPALRLDLQADLQSRPPSQAASVVESWDTMTTEGALDLRPRFHSLVLNACSGPWLAGVGASRAVYLKAEGVLPWWDHDQHLSALDDSRDSFARRVPMAPLPYDSLPALRGWLGIPPKQFDASLCDRREVVPEAEEDPILVPVEGDEPSIPTPTPRTFQHFSPLGLARWCCLHALSSLSPHGLERIRAVSDRVRTLPIRRLDLDDRYRFLAWLLMTTDLTETAFAEILAPWLVSLGLEDDDRLKDWSAPVAEEIGPDAPLRRPGLLEFVHTMRREIRKIRRERQEKPLAGPRSRT